MFVLERLPKSSGLHFPVITVNIILSIRERRKEETMEKELSLWEIATVIIGAVTLLLIAAIV